MLGAQIWTHVDLHQIEVEVSVQNEVEANHFEEESLVRVVLDRVGEFGFFGSVNVANDFSDWGPNFGFWVFTQ